MSGLCLPLQELEVLPVLTIGGVGRGGEDDLRFQTWEDVKDWREG